jgi:hypothetical protein
MKYSPAIIKTVVTGILLLLAINSHRPKNIHTPSAPPVEANKTIINQISVLPGFPNGYFTGNRETDLLTDSQPDFKILFSGITETAPYSSENPDYTLSRGSTRGTSPRQRPESNIDFSAERKTGPSLFISTLQPIDLIIEPSDTDL